MRKSIHIHTKNRGIYSIDDLLEDALKNASARDSMCNLFVQHTSCSLMITENTDPDVLEDIENFFSSTVPDSITKYNHSAEGKDDMPAHIRSLLCQTSLSIPLQNQRLLLGTWQGVYLYEHRQGAFKRTVVMTTY